MYPVSHAITPTERYPANSFNPRARPRLAGPTRSTFMITVMDQARAWLIPSRMLARSNQIQRLAQMMINGTGKPTNQPRMSTLLRPQVSPNRAAKRLQRALTTPKLTMKETMPVLEVRPNSRSPMRGTTVRSRPTMAPTKALISTRSENWPRFSCRPNRMSGPSVAICLPPLDTVLVRVKPIILPFGTLRQTMTLLGQLGRVPSPGVERSDLLCPGGRRRDILQHELHEGVPIVQLERHIKPAFEADGRTGFSAQ